MAECKPFAWHDEYMQRFRDAIEQHRLPHAILLTGPAGTGKQQLARCLIHHLIGEASKSANYKNLLQAGTHPDVMLVEPEEDKKQISVDQIRALSEKISLTPQLSTTKIGVIHPAQAMNRNAANALLKTLEEPQGNTVILLISHNHGLLPQTILSRCQHVHVGIPPAGQALKWLQEQDIDHAVEYLQLAGGAPLKALAAANEGWLERYQSLISDLSMLLHYQDNMVSVSARWRDLDISLLVSWLSNIVRSVVKLKIHGQSALNVPANLLKLLKISYDEIDLRQLIQYSEFLDKTLLEVDNNLNQEMMFEQIFSQWTALKRAA
jgi:DNA polymerase-3 subunit delta'